MLEYQSTKIAEKNYAITAFIDNEVYEFVVGVAESESEIAGLVEFCVNSLRSPQPPVGPTYAQKREAEYPPITDYIDGVVKGDQAQIDAYIAACLAVKAKYPKP